jgi:hypothetical protein
MTVRKAGLGVSLLLAAVSCGGLLAVHAGPEPSRAAAEPEKISFAPRPSAAATSRTFSATCSLAAGAATDSRPDPAWVNASFANDNCRAPALPARLSGLTASRETIMAYTVAEKRYDAGAAVYQRCIQHFVSVRAAEAQQRKQAPDVALAAIENHRIVTSRNDEKKLSDQVALAVTQFNAYGSDCPD